MYMGHLGIGLGARRLSQSLPVWALLLAPILPDASDALSGFTPWVGWWVEFSHTLLGVAGLAVFMGLLGWTLSRRCWPATLAALLVVSHLPADYVTSRIHAWRGGPAIGLGLYHYPVADFVVESTVILIGLYFYRQSLDEAQSRPRILLAMGATLMGFQLLGDVLVKG